MTSPGARIGPYEIIGPLGRGLLARVGFDISSDGTRLLMVQEAKTDEQRAASLAVVQNWFTGLRR